ncbi:hypothetical protein QP568_04590 [Propionimicrobium lymphophilum]|nr:hypothetical protein [Propionimicrobium lymphophilum]MDK7709588.1 hypothetical protein [Propionimicrobium lymphophilum]MDK7733574.1 hypothetical protein [Propionimicrobium lymphophilum]
MDPEGAVKLLHGKAIKQSVGLRPNRTSSMNTARSSSTRTGRRTRLTR